MKFQHDGNIMVNVKNDDMNTCQISRKLRKGNFENQDMMQSVAAAKILVFQHEGNILINVKNDMYTFQISRKLRKGGIHMLKRNKC